MSDDRRFMLAGSFDCRDRRALFGRHSWRCVHPLAGIACEEGVWVDEALVSLTESEPRSFGARPTVDLRRSGSQTRRSLTRPSPARAELDGLPHGNAVECSERQKGGFLASVFPGENPGPRHPGSGSKALLSSIAFAEKSPEARRASSNAHRPGSIPRGPPELRRRLPRSPTLA